MIIVDDDCCRNCGPLWTIMWFCGRKHGSTNPGCEFHCFKHVQLITWTSEIWDIAGFSQHSKLNQSFIVWTEISPFSSLGSSYDFMMEESIRTQSLSQNFWAQKQSDPFSLEKSSPSSSVWIHSSRWGCVPCVPVSGCPDPQRWIYFKTMGLASSSAVGQAAEALGKFSTLIRVNLSTFD